MFLLELFSGTKSVSNTAETLGFRCVSLDIARKYKPTLVMDILDFDCETFKAAFGVPDFIWGSPDCRHYSKVRNSMPHIPRDIEGSNKLVLKLLQIIKFFYNHNNHLVFFIENPQTGLLKKQDFMSSIPYEVVSYCKYGFKTKKSTMIWSNVRLELLRCNAKEGLCEYKKKHNKHEEGIGHCKGERQMNRKTRLTLPSLLIESILKQAMKAQKQGTLLEVNMEHI